MTNQLRFWVGALALSAIAYGGPRTYDLVVWNAAKAGDVQVDPGEYKVKIEGANAVFTGAQTGKSFTVPVKVESAEKKYRQTEILSTKQGETEQINAIEFGGSKTELEFGQ